MHPIDDAITVSVESEGSYRPEELVPEAIRVMREKIQAVRQATASLLQEVEDEEGERRAT